MSRRGLRTVLIIAGAITGVTLVARRLGYNLGANTVVRCRQGHVFTTIWIPGIKLKELDLVVARVQRCPVGKHWSLVVPVRDADLTDEERQFAREHHDVAFPDASPPENRRQKRPSAWPAHRRDVDVELRAELLARCEDDQRIRKEAVQSGPGPRIPSPDLLAELRRIDESNTLWLAELTERVGWPGRTLVGEDGADAAWCLAQHADWHPEHQRKFQRRAAVGLGPFAEYEALMHRRD